jgi:hypothetical protein
VGPLSPRHGASSGSGWRRRAPDVEGSCEYTEKAVVDSRQGMVLQIEGWALGQQLLTVKNMFVTKCQKGLGLGRIFLINDLSYGKWTCDLVHW